MKSRLIHFAARQFLVSPLNRGDCDASITYSDLVDALILAVVILFFGAALAKQFE